MELIEKPLPPETVSLPDPAAAPGRSAGHHADGNPRGPTAPTRCTPDSTSPSSAARRTVLVGPNSAGKSTLLKILCRRGGVPEGRTRARTQRQDRILQPAPHRDVESQPHRCWKGDVQRPGPAGRGPRRAGFLPCFREGSTSPPSVLSGGEKPAQPDQVLVDPPNLLLMDEPTTHLDIHSVESLTLAWAGTRGHVGLHLPRRALHPQTRDQGPARHRRTGPSLRRRL